MDRIEALPTGGSPATNCVERGSGENSVCRGPERRLRIEHNFL